MIAKVSSPWRRAVGAVLLALLTGCSENEVGEAIAVRLSPERLESTAGSNGEGVWVLFDRDTRSGWTPPIGVGGTARVHLQLDRPSVLTHVKVFGSSPYTLDVLTVDGKPVEGLSRLSLDALGPGWHVFSLPVPILASDLAFELARTGEQDAPLAEIELWGTDRPAAPVDVGRLRSLDPGA